MIIWNKKLYDLIQSTMIYRFSCAWLLRAEAVFLGFYMVSVWHLERHVIHESYK
jgi:hypothetical protein